MASAYDLKMALKALQFDQVLQAVASRAATSYGEAHLLALHPICDRASLEVEFDRIEALTGAVQRGEELPFGGIRNVDEPLKRAATAGIHLEVDELLNIGRLATASGKLKQFIVKRADSLAALKDFAEIIHSMPGLEKEINRALDENSGEVRDDASPDLRKIRRALEVQVQRVRKKLDSMVHELGGEGILLESGYSVRDERYVLAVKQPHKGRVRGIVHGYSASGGTVYVEPDELVELGNEVRRLAEEEADEVRRILTLLTDCVRDHLPQLEPVIQAVTELDSLQGRARFAWDCGAMRPQLSDHELRLVGARHPLLLLRKGLNGTVPLDLHLSEDAPVLVITGPNAGGKTVALKTLGLATTLVLSGLWPPAGEGTVVPLLDQWHVVIGDDQSLEGDLSSFTGHLEKLKAITHSPDAKKLVLIDEIASGTDPTEGAGLAMALLEDAVQHGWWTVVTTHMGALKAFAHGTDGVRNGSMQFDREHLTPTYRFLPDLPGSSYALEIASRVGLPEDIVARARLYVGEDRLKLEDLIEELTSRLHRVQENERRLATQLTRATGVEKLLQERIDRLEAQRAEALAKAAAAAEQLLADANRAIEKSVKEIREQQASADVIRAARERVEQQKERVASVQQETEKKRRSNAGGERQRESAGESQSQGSESEPERLAGPVVVGDQVRLTSGMQGEVLALKGDKAQVAAGSLKIWLPLNEVMRVNRSQGDGGRVRVVMDEGTHTSRSTIPEDVPTRTELKLIGMRAEQAEIALGKYLESLALSGLPYARIVHGKGTGTLRAMVQAQLEHHPLVAAFRLGDQHEGGDGVTIVEIKE